MTLFERTKRYLHTCVANYHECVILGRILQKVIGRDIQKETECEGDETNSLRIKVEIGKYLELFSKCIYCIAAIALLPCFFFIFLMALPKSSAWHSVFSATYVIAASALGVLLIRVSWPLAVIMRQLRKLPRALYQELCWPIWFKADMLSIGINCLLLWYLFWMWNVTATVVIFLLLALAWLWGPWLAYTSHRTQLFLGIRLAQLAVLLLVTFMTIISPVPVSHYQWWAERSIANKIRPVQQREVTNEWETLQWFTQEGSPNVWYSYSTDRGYRLYIAPGNDMETNEILKPVGGKETKNIIYAYFRNAKENVDRAEQQRLAAVERQLAQKDERKRTEAEALRKQNELRVQKERAVFEAAQVEKKKKTRELLIQKYVFSEWIEAAPHDIALIVLDNGQLADSALTERISNTLASTGIVNIGSPFKLSFIESAYFKEIINGKLSPERDFQVEDFASRLLVIQMGHDLKPSEPISGVPMLAAITTWHIRLITLPNSASTDFTDIIKAQAIGFKENDAINNARERAEREFNHILPKYTEQLRK